MTTIEAQKAELVQQMRELEGRREWISLKKLAIEIQNTYPKWFPPATYLQAATNEIAALKHPNDPDVQAAVEANRLVRKIADELGL